MNELENLIEIISASASGGRTRRQVYALLHESFPAIIDEAMTAFEKRAGIIRSLKHHRALIDVGIENWYTGLGPDSQFWPAVEAHLRDVRTPHEVHRQHEMAS
jgi:hypothetical protein